MVKTSNILKTDKFSQVVITLKYLDNSWLCMETSGMILSHRDWLNWSSLWTERCICWNFWASFSLAFVKYELLFKSILRKMWVLSANKATASKSSLKILLFMLWITFSASAFVSISFFKDWNVCVFSPCSSRLRAFTLDCHLAFVRWSHFHCTMFMFIIELPSWFPLWVIASLLLELPHILLWVEMSPIVQ